MEVVGWLGTLLYLLAHSLLSLGVINRFKYVALNAAAALVVSFYSVYEWSLQPVFINIVWSGLSFWGLFLHSDENPQDTGQKRGSRDMLYSVLIIVSGLVAISVALVFIKFSLFFILSWLSVWLYSSTYFSFIFLRMSDRWFFILCIVSAAIIIPQLFLDSNYPVIGVQVLWIFWSLVGLFRPSKPASPEAPL